MNQRWRLSAEFETQVRLPQPIHVGVRFWDLHACSSSPLARQIQHSDNLTMRASCQADSFKDYAALLRLVRPVPMLHSVEGISSLLFAFGPVSDLRALRRGARMCLSRNVCV